MPTSAIATKKWPKKQKQAQRPGNITFALISMDSIAAANKTLYGTRQKQTTMVSQWLAFAH